MNEIKTSTGVSWFTEMRGDTKVIVALFGGITAKRIDGETDVYFFRTGTGEPVAACSLDRPGSLLWGTDITLTENEKQLTEALAQTFWAVRGPAE